MMHGPLFVVKCVFMSIFLGSFFLFLQNSLTGGAMRPFYGNDAIMRGLIFTIIF
jgi:hypothetical protein